MRLRPKSKKAAPAKKKQPVDPAEKVAAAVSKNVLDHTPTAQEKKAAAPVVHYLFGTAVGAAYGVAAETIPGFGSLFAKSPMSTGAGEFGAHLVYGTVSEGLRRAVRSYVLR